MRRMNAIQGLPNLVSLLCLVALGLAATACSGEDGAVGPQGPPGVAGPPGPRGPAGVDGKDGKDGKDGADGAPGADGVDGAPGRDGVDGKDGADGPPGRDGVAGKDGKDASPRPFGVSLDFLGRYSTGVFDQGAAQILSYDAPTGRLFALNAQGATVDVLGIEDPSAPERIDTIDLTQADTARALGSATSLATSNGILAAGIAADPKTVAGLVAFYDTDSLALLGTAEVGPLPDMLTFTPDGSKVVVAIEGEPNDDSADDVEDAYSIDPEGAVAIIDVPTQFSGPLVVRSAGFTAFNDRADELRAAGVRIFGPAVREQPGDPLTPFGATVAQDLEPEYIAVSADSKTAWVTLQENNAIAVVDIDAATVTEIRPLGFKNHALLGNELDASDRDNAVNLRSWPVFGMYMPDAISRFEVAGQTYLLTVNEGDVREWGGFVDSIRLGNAGYVLDPTAFPDAESLKLNQNLGRLNVSRYLGDTDGDGDFDRIYAFGGRSFSIWRAKDGELVYDSGNELELLTAKRVGEHFNSTNSASGGDARSDDKGAEPEGARVVDIEGGTFAFIALERTGGVMVYDVTLPENPRFVTS